LLAGRAAWRALWRRRDALLGIAFFAGLLSLQFNAFVLTSAFFFYFVAVLLLVGEGPGSKPGAGAAKHCWVAAIAAFPVAILLVAMGVHLLVADVLLARVRTQLEAGDIPGAAATHQAVRRWDPRRGSSDFYYSRNMAARVRGQVHILLSVKAWQEAVEAGIRATRFAEDRHNAYYHLASLYAQVNNHKDAEKSLRGAIGVAPNWFKPHWMLAQVLRAGGRIGEAVTEAEVAVKLDAGKHAEVAETLRELRVR
jgi:tetratricopeptide (TPR) repeat protein